MPRLELWITPPPVLPSGGVVPASPAGDPESFLRVQRAYEDVKESAAVAYLPWFVLDVIGGHRFYPGDKGLGMVCTLGGFGIWALIESSPRMRG